MHKNFSFSQLPDNELIAFYGALFSMSAIDGLMDADEINYILELIDLEGIPESARSQIESYMVTPPTFEECLQVLSSSDEVLRYGMMLNLMEIAWADEILQPEETEALQSAQRFLGISDTLITELNESVQTIKRKKMEKLKGKEESQIRVFLTHLQESIQSLTERIFQDSQTDHTAVELDTLTERLKILQQLSAIKHRRDLKKKLTGQA